MTDIDRLVERLEALCHPSAEALSDCERINAFITVGDQAAAALKEQQARVKELEGALIEERAKSIYARMDYDGAPGTIKPKWVEHGNSLKQDEARAFARAALKGETGTK